MSYITNPSQIPVFGVGATNSTKILAALSPLIAAVSGALAAWLLVHVKVLALFQDQTHTAALIAGLFTFGVTAVLTWLSHHENVIPLAIHRTSARKANQRIQEMTADNTLLPQAFLVPSKTAIIIAALSPYISIAAGAIAAWLLVNLHWLDFLPKARLAGTIASAGVFLITAAVTWLAVNRRLIPLLSI